MSVEYNPEEKMKSRLTFVSVILLALLSSCAIISRHQKQYFPKQIKNLYLGMTYQKFEKTKDTSNLTIYDEFDHRTEYTEVFEEGSIKEITYYFTKGDSQILFELIIEYHPDTSVIKLSREMYGSPNADDEWLFDTKEGFDMMIWTYENKIILAGKLPGSGWE
jgi:hypothetical protein